MKKVIYFIVIGFSLFITCCEDQQPVKEIKKYSKADLFIKRFLKENPKMSQNDIYLKEAQDKFNKQVISFFKDSMGITFIPLKAVSVAIKRGKYVIHFECMDINENEISSKSQLDVFAITDEKTARSIVQGNSYYIEKYSKLEEVPYIFIENFTDDRVWSTYSEIDLVNQHYAFGNFSLKLLKLKDNQVEPLPDTTRKK